MEKPQGVNDIYREIESEMGPFSMGFAIVFGLLLIALAYSCIK